MLHSKFESVQIVSGTTVHTGGGAEVLNEDEEIMDGALVVFIPFLPRGFKRAMTTVQPSLSPFAPWPMEEIVHAHLEEGQPNDLLCTFQVPTTLRAPDHGEAPPITGDIFVLVAGVEKALFGQEPHMHGFGLCLVRVPEELPSFTGGTIQLSRTQIWHWNFLGVAHC